MTNCDPEKALAMSNFFDSVEPPGTALSTCLLSFSVTYIPLKARCLMSTKTTSNAPIFAIFCKI